MKFVAAGRERVGATAEEEVGWRLMESSETVEVGSSVGSFVYEFDILVAI